MMEVSKWSSYWCLALMASIYVIGELGHFLLGTVSRSMAQDIHYGDKGCLKISSLTEIKSDVCTDAENEAECLVAEDTLRNGSLVKVCTWDYTGLGLQYHVLAGPAFVAVFTVAGLAWGYIADRFNRVYFLSIATFIFSCSIIATSFSTQYWHVLLSRMALALGESGCSPLASGIIADMFPKSRRGLAMSLFNWGIYIGYGLSYTIGNYVTDANILNKGWKASYVISGIPGILLAFVFLFTGSDPQRTKIEEDDVSIAAATDDNKMSREWNDVHKSTELKSTGKDNGGLQLEELQGDGSKLTITKSDEINPKGQMQILIDGLKVGWNILKNPAMMFLLLGACVRHAAGFCWGYNSALYFETYYPDYDVSLWLTGISIGAGATGTLIGGYLSDRLVSKLGISARALVLASSQLLAAPFAFSLFFLEPPLALYSLLVGYIAAEMWFGVMFAILVELVPSDIRSKVIAIVLFCINNVGGNTPVIVDPLANATTYRTAIIILYPGALLSSSILFFICWIILRSQRT